MDRRNLLAAVAPTADVLGRPLTRSKALAILEPWYSLFTIPGRGDVRAVFDRVVARDFVGRTGDGPGETQDRETVLRFIDAAGAAIPDMRHTVKEFIVSGATVAVRGESTGTPAGDLFGVPGRGRSFRIMTMDMLTIRGGMIVHTYHLENWFGALNQLRA